MATEIKKIISRRDTAAKWEANNPILAQGEIGVDTTNKVMKIGDGVTPWKSLTGVGGVEIVNDQKDRVISQYGKNLYCQLLTTYGRLDSVGKIQSSTVNLVTEYIPVKPNTSYILTNKDEEYPTGNNYYVFYDADYKIIGVGNTKEITTPDNCKYIRCTIGATQTEVMLEEGTERTEYEEGNPINNYLESIYNHIDKYEEKVSDIETEIGRNTSDEIIHLNTGAYSDTNNIFLPKGSVITDFGGYTGGLMLCPEKTMNLSNYTTIRETNLPYTLTTDIQSIRSTAAIDNDIAYTVYASGIKGELEGLKEKLDNIDSANLNKIGSFINRGTLSTGESFEFPKNSISVGEYITFSANINGTFNALYIGHGKAEGAYMKITANKVVVYSHITNPISEKEFEHGLTIENNIQVLIEKSKNSTTKLKIASNGKSYSFSYSSWYGNKGTPFVESEGSELKDCSFGWTCKGIDSDIWAFGDSYFGVTGTIRWMAYLIADNHTNLVVNGFGGQGSVSAYTDLTNLLTIGTPKKILWCLGMNDADSLTAVNNNWLNTYNSLKSVCEMNNIELILATIPTVPSRINKFKNEIIRSSGYRYIDFDKAVGASEDTGAWYSDMLSSDGVHPSETGALALYNQAIADMPELLTC